MKWISSAISRADSHLLRSVVDAIVVGSGIVLADDPQLTARDPDVVLQIVGSLLKAQIV